MARLPLPFLARRCSLAILIALAVVAVPASRAALPADLSLWSAGDPDPTIPFSDRHPVAIVIEREDAARAVASSGIDVESVRREREGWIVLANVSPSEETKLRAGGHEIYRLRNLALEEFHAHPPGTRDPAAWPTFEQLQAELQAIAAANPNICRLVSIGRSVQGRDLWFMKITDNPDVAEDEPEFKYSSSMHGDEVTGMEMCRRLIHLLVDGYGVDPTLTSYVNEMEIWICPMHNPDGFVAGSRYNAHGVDLNRNFPDPITDPVDDPAGREPETQETMLFGYGHRFILSANYHGGALVVNYPWDSHAAYTPDDTMIRNFSLGYAYRNPPMWNSPEFPNGVTIGWAWYIVNGGMQDWCYEWRDEIDVTIEVSNTKWPPYSQMDQFWNENRDAMLYYLSRSLIGIAGTVTSAQSGAPVDGTVDVVQIGKSIRTDPALGDYHRMLEPGTYTLTVEAFGYESQTIPGIDVVDGPATHRDVALVPLPTYQLSGSVTEEGTGLPLAAAVRAYRYDTQELVAETATEPGSGAYALSLMSFTYDVRVTAPGHAPETRRIAVTGDRVEDFILPTTANRVLVVRDGATTRIADDLGSLGIPVTAEASTLTDPAMWDDYRLLVWSAGANGNPVWDAAMRQALEDYVAAGGGLLIEGGQIGYDVFRTPGYPSFGANVLHCSAWDVSNAGDLSVAAPGHALVTTPNALPGLLDLQYTAVGDEDAVRPLASATLIYRTQSYPADAGVVAYDDAPADPSKGQIVYYSFNYDRLTDLNAARRLLENTVIFLDRVDPAAVATEELRGGRLAIAPARPNPAQGTIRFDLSVPLGGDYRAGIYDAGGRRLLEWVTTAGVPGSLTMEWNGRIEGDGMAPAGIYFLRVRSLGGSSNRTFVWMGR